MRLQNYLLDYCKESSIHGLQYIGAQHLPLVERVTWTLIFLISFTCSLLLIRNVWLKWNETPVIISLEENLRPVWQIPFPAITICPETKVKKTQIKYGVVTTRSKLIQDIEELICGVGFSDRELQNGTLELMEEVAPEKGIIEGFWLERFKTQDPLEFQPILTDQGLCYSANIMPSSEFFTADTFHGLSSRYLNFSSKDWYWNPDTGYDSSANIVTQPYRALGHITIHIEMQLDDSTAQCSSTEGYRVVLHSPADFPLVGERYFLVPLHNNVLVSVKPQVTVTSAALESYRPERRQCYYSSEKQLRFFKIYTRQNCELECVTNYTLNKCGCVAFFMPREIDTPVCGPNKVNCSRIQPGQLHWQESEVYSKCNCLQSCSDIQYHAERSQAEIMYPKGLVGFVLSTITISFHDSEFTATRRGELFGLTDFIANCGGLLGLGMGISMLSVAELLYWTFIRVWRNTARFSNHVSNS